MTSKEIISKCNQIPNGRFFKINWKTNCEKSLCADARKSGDVVTKEVSCVARKGIHYTHIKRVQETKEMNGDFQIDPITGKKVYFSEERSWAEDVVPNLIIRHKKTGKHYMVVYATDTRPKVQYYLNGKPVATKILKESGKMINSYWNKDENCAVMTVPIESIVSIG